MAKDQSDQTLANRLAETRARMNSAINTWREPGTTVSLIAVSKTRPSSDVRLAANEGHLDFGENYVQEAVDKIRALSDLSLRWHFIGHLQSNKCAVVAEHFDWVHSIDRLKIAKRLNDARNPDQAALNVLIQVNMDGETTKSGVAPDDAPALAREITGMPRLAFKGLMAIPAPEQDFARQRGVFRRVRELAETVTSSGVDCPCLSMGMTADMEAAIAEGATHIRIGTAIFGERPKKET